MTDETRERFLGDLQARGLLSDEEAETARRLLRQADAGEAAAVAEEEPAVVSSGLELLGRIGRGSQAVVYRCRQVEMDRVVAAKILHPRAAGEASARDRFLREARAAAVLTHPNIVTIHEIQPLRNTVAIIMEYVDGGTLEDLLKLRKRFDPAEAIVIVRQVAEGLKAAHSRGIIHRDIKPRNIMLTSEGLVKIADMGLARHVAEAEDGKGKAFGTPYYISPEQVTGDPPPDHRTDLYSLGVTLYEMVAGRPPFLADTPHEIMRMHVLRQPPDPRDFVPDLPQTLCWLLAKAMAREPEDRYASAEAFLSALDALDLSVGAEGPARPAAATPPAAAEPRAEARGDVRVARQHPAPYTYPRDPFDSAAPRSGQALPVAARKARRRAAPVRIIVPVLAAVAVGLTLLGMWAVGVFDTGSAPPADGTARVVPSPPAWTPVDPKEAQARQALESARALEKMPDAERDNVLAAYRNVIAFYGDTRAALEAEQALFRLEAAGPPKEPVPPPEEPPLPPEPPPQEPPKKPSAEEAPELTPFTPPAGVAEADEPDVIEVHASSGVTIHGQHARYEKKEDRDNIGFWSNTDTWVSWDVTLPRAGTYEIEIAYAAEPTCAGAKYEVFLGGTSIQRKVESTGGWGRFETKRLGTIKVPASGPTTLAVKPLLIKGAGLMNLQAVRLMPVP